MQRFQNILVGIDVLQCSAYQDDPLPSEPNSAMAHAAWVHQHAGGKLKVMSVLPSGAPEDTEHDLVEQARELLTDKAAQVFGTADVDIEVAIGTPFIELTHEVMRAGHDLVIVAARRHSLAQRGIVGSSAIKLLRKCPCPVWVAPRRFERGPKTVLTSAGFHGLTAQLLELSVSLVQLTDGEWHVVHCMEYPKEGAMRLRKADAEEIESYRREAREYSWKHLHELTDPVKAATGIDPKLWLAQGHPSEEIALAAQELGADVLVMGTVGRSGVPGLIIGNTAEHLLKQAECSVLGMKPEGFISPIAFEG